MSEGERDETRERDPADEEVVREQADAAAAEAGAIGGRTGVEEERDDAERPVSEAGGGEAEGFEQATEALRDAAEHGEGRDPAADRGETEAHPDPGTHGEGDAIRSTETGEDTAGTGP
ncbi:MAG TPA: hypothetical protein VEK39_08040 [Solirubrobacterales bacterium]|nr:hypothetical protein [Solirubrobacterales bacterium]